MADSEPTDSDPTDPTSPEALSDFLDGIEERIGGAFEVDVISSAGERQRVREMIAEDLGIDPKKDAYHPAATAASTSWDATMTIGRRYQKLLEEGELREDPEWDGLFPELERHYKEDEPFRNVDNTV